MTAPDLDWVTPLAGLGPVWGLRRPLEVTWSVPKAPDGPVAVTVRFEPSPSAGGDEAGRSEDVDVVELSSTAAEAARLVSGELDANVAWMSGRLKAAGPTGPLLALLAHAARA